MIHEVVCTKNYLDVGLLIDVDDQFKPKRVLAGASTYGSDTEYGGVSTLDWIRTGIFLQKDEWKIVSYNKNTDQILSGLGIKKRIKEERNKYMVTVKQVVDDRAFDKNYNIEWYLGNGKIKTTSAVMTSIENGYIFFRYPSGGILMIKDDAIRSLECLE